MMGIFNPGWNFKSLNRDETSSRILSDKTVKEELRLYAKKSSWTVNRAEISPWLERT